ncbi:MAG: SDR family oxidoreductase [Myxococcota bacterium]|nr:SDR family oxidoreductase [Myxococcota bacterium]
MRLQGRRILVVGASSGLGRAAAAAAAAEGARVAFAARRLDRLEEAAAEAGGDCIAVRCDVRDEVSCDAAVAQAADSLGGIDAIVYAPGISTFCPIENIDASMWRAVLETNLVGASLIARAAIPHLEASDADVGGKAVFLSSIVIDDSPPRPEQATYVVSKVALETLIRAWQGEHRRVGFTTIAIGDSLSEFAVGQDISEVGRIVQNWSEQGYMYGRIMAAESVAAQVVNALASPETVRRIAITPHYPRAEDGEGGDETWESQLASASESDES